MWQPRVDPSHRLADRHAAGRLLAERLRSHERDHPVVLGLPRGGVPIAYEIARRLGAALDVLIVGKVAAPDNRECGLGAVVEGEPPFLDLDRIQRAGYDLEELQPIVAAVSLEVERRAQFYHRQHARVPLAGRSVILVDDGVATGGTVLASLGALRTAGVRHVTVALGVAPPGIVDTLRQTADEVHALLTPAAFVAVGEWYEDFSPVSDDEVLRLLRASTTAPTDRPYPLPPTPGGGV